MRCVLSGRFSWLRKIYTYTYIHTCFTEVAEKGGVRQERVQSASSEAIARAWSAHASPGRPYLHCTTEDRQCTTQVWRWNLDVVLSFSEFRSRTWDIRVLDSTV